MSARWQLSAGGRSALRRVLRWLTLWGSCCLLLAAPVRAQLVVDWGAINLEQSTTINFQHLDISRNFTDQYLFSLAGGSEVGYSVQVLFHPCRNGCGNVAVEYGVYDANGGLLSDGGSAVLTAGSYSFQVKGSGMGAGNSLDYSGSISFFVTAVPEAADGLLFALVLLWLAWQGRQSGLRWPGGPRLPWKGARNAR